MISMLVAWKTHWLFITSHVTSSISYLSSELISLVTVHYATCLLR